MNINRVFILNLASNIAINYDHGILPSASTLIKADLRLNDLQYGLLGSFVYFGLVLGSIISSTAFCYYKSKNIVLLSIVLNLIGISVFLNFKQFAVLLASRCLIGFAQILIIIYLPVWIDIKANNQKKTIWLTIT